MGLLGTSNSTVLGAVQAQNDQNFKTVNNLLSLQDNHVEEFLNYHGEAFLSSLEKLMEDVVERVVSKMLNQLSFTTDSTTGTMKVHPDAMREFERITQENIDLDIKNILAVSLNQEVINQRKMAKQQYLESQGFSGGNINNMHGANNMYAQGQMAMNNGSGYPIPPAGTDNYGRPYWIDSQTGQMSYEPPNSGLGLGSAIQKGAAWAKWLM
ncbi:hypothetical protein QKV95_gp086 [Poseidoniales virus YSH_150918]|uniref:Uncharacterized protein n=1 Tax=Poseidoniales virus YSH_150918 TaxID=3071324 RepID=A0A976UAZ5_9CAUD|nr:hypothetical protein QKV95_gp086 [Yangshan Harbor Poseidoniales virus]UVF62563.1 hypothetical protein [Poseidoniales virus YSH_150918]